MSKKPLRVIAGAPDRPLAIGDIEMPCYVLEDEVRVLSQRGIVASLGLRSGGGSSGAATKVPRFLTSKTLKPFISNNLMMLLNEPILFASPQGGATAFGYPATVLPDICEVVLSARADHKLLRSQQHIATQCEMIMRGLARVGIIALVDEATGFQRIREERALATILEKFIAKEIQPWAMTFPYEFYDQIFRLKGWPGPDGVKRPSIIGHYTNNIIYSRVAPGVLEELQRLNPSRSGGGRKWRHHQWFKPDPGYIKLNQHMAAVIALMRAAPNWVAFERSLKRAFPQLRDQLELELGE